MKAIKNTLKISFLLSAVSVFTTGRADAQMVGANAYLKGNYVEIGIDGLGGFEGADVMVSPAPAGMHFRSGNMLFGFVANPQMNSWTGSAYDGDFFTPGSPENGWGFYLDTVINSGNNCASSQQIPGAITSWSYSAPLTICEWEGDDTLSNLHFKIQYTLNDTDLFYTTTVSIKNNGSTTIPDVYYYRNLDPDNNESINSNFTTENTVMSQITMGGTNTSVKATQALPWTSVFEFLAIDSNWLAGYGGFANRNGKDLWNGGVTPTGTFTQTVGFPNTADEAIYLAYKVSNLIPGNTQTFKFASIFDTLAVASAVATLNQSTVSVNDIDNSQSLISVYPNPFSDNAAIVINKSVSLKNAEMIVYNVLGKEMLRVKNIESHEFKLEKKNLSAGMYVYKIMNNNREIGTGKLIIK